MTHLTNEDREKLKIKFDEHFNITDQIKAPLLIRYQDGHVGNFLDDTSGWWLSQIDKILEERDRIYGCQHIVNPVRCTGICTSDLHNAHCGLCGKHLFLPYQDEKNFTS